MNIIARTSSEKMEGREREEQIKKKITASFKK